MATKIFRFRAVTDVDLGQLRSLADSTVTVADKSGGKILDISVEEAFEDDLKEVMDSFGFEFVSSAPASSAETQFKNDNNIGVQIEVLDEGTSLGTFAKVNFKGATVNVVDAGGGQADIEHSSAVFDSTLILVDCDREILVDCDLHVMAGC